MRLTLVALLLTAAPAFAAEPERLITACDALMQPAIEMAAKSDANSAEWNNLNLAILQHRRNCALPMALACHLSEAPQECFASTITALDARAEEERLKLDAFADAGGTLFGDLPRQRARTTPARQAEREAFCRQQSGDAATFVGVLGGDVTATCYLEVTVNQWATLSFSGAAPAALSLLPPAAE